MASIMSIAKLSTAYNPEETNLSLIATKQGIFSF